MRKQIIFTCPACGTGNKTFLPVRNPAHPSRPHLLLREGSAIKASRQRTERHSDSRLSRESSCSGWDHGQESGCRAGWLRGVRRERDPRVFCRAGASQQGGGSGKRDPGRLLPRLWLLSPPCSSTSPACRRFLPLLAACRRDLKLPSAAREIAECEGAGDSPAERGELPAPGPAAGSALLRGQRSPSGDHPSPAPSQAFLALASSALLCTFCFKSYRFGPWETPLYKPPGSELKPGQFCERHFHGGREATRCGHASLPARRGEGGTRWVTLSVRAEPPASASDPLPYRPGHGGAVRGPRSQPTRLQSPPSARSLPAHLNAPTCPTFPPLSFRLLFSPGAVPALLSCQGPAGSSVRAPGPAGTSRGGTSGVISTPSLRLSVLLA